MQEIKQVKEFTTRTSLRQLVAEEISPTVQNIEKECNRIVNEINSLKEESQIIHRFENEKINIENNVKILQKEMEESIKNIQQNKTEGQIAQVRTASNISTLKEQILSFQRVLKRRDQNFQTYDKKISGVMNTLCVHQGDVDDRIFVLQNKFKGLLNQTLQMTKTVKRDFDNSMTNNQILKNQLVHVIKRAEERQKLLDLYISEREELPQKLFAIQEQIRNCVKKDELQAYKMWQNMQIQHKIEENNKILKRLIPQETNNMQLDNIKLAEINEMQTKIKRLQILPTQFAKLSLKVESLAINDENKFMALRQETEDMEEKIIEVIDKKMETIQQNIENAHTQTEESFEEKLLKLKQDLQIKLNDYYQQQASQLDLIRSIKTTDGNGQQIMISRELQIAKKERHKIQDQFKIIKSIAQGLNDKLLLFSNKITMCRSDIELFSETTTKQLRKIIDLKKEEENHMELVGKILSSFMQSLFILTSLFLQSEKKEETTSFVTYNDGIILEFGGETPTHQINYRRSHINVKDIKQSLLYCLVNFTDEIISNHNILKWKTNLPSQFFNKFIKNNLTSRAKGALRSQSLLIHSPRRRVRKNDGQQDILLDFPLQSKELRNNNNQSPTITISNSNLTFTSVKRSSQIKKSYKIKQQEDHYRKQIEQRNCFTTSRSHRKSKQSFV